MVVEIEKQSNYLIKHVTTGPFQLTHTVPAKNMINFAYCIPAKQEAEGSSIQSDIDRDKEEKKSPFMGAMFSIIPGCGHYYAKRNTAGIIFTSVRTLSLVGWVTMITSDDGGTLAGGILLGFLNYIVLLPMDMIFAAKHVKNYNRELKENINITFKMKKNQQEDNILFCFSYSF